MKSRHLLSLVTGLLLLGACKEKSSRTEPGPSENNIDAARNFVRAALDGRFKDARDYMLPDSLNMNYMDVAERAYNNADKSVRDGYRNASIRIYSPVNEINDSTSIIVYANSFKNDPDTLRVVRNSGRWLVDLKYLYEHDRDTLLNKPLKDSLP